MTFLVAGTLNFFLEVIALTDRLVDLKDMKRHLVSLFVALHIAVLTKDAPGLLTFTLYHLVKTPGAMRKLKEEVDRVLGNRRIQLEDVDKLDYTIGGSRTFRIFELALFTLISLPPRY